MLMRPASPAFPSELAGAELAAKTECANLFTDMLGLEYRIKDLESGDKDLSLVLSREQLSDAVGDLDVDLEQSRITLKAQLRLQGSVVQCDGWLRGELVLPCQRCLEPARVPVELRLHTVFTPSSHGADSSARDDDEDVDEDLDYAHHDGETVDLWPILREDLILAIPITVRCQEECRGLCPTCGKNRNLTSCDCKPAPSLSPFAELNKIKLST
jgi:uncharacterized protein